MRLEDVLKTAANTDLEVRIDYPDGDFEIFNEYDYIMGVGFSIYKDATVVSLMAINDTLCIFAEV